MRSIIVSTSPRVTHCFISSHRCSPTKSASGRIPQLREFSNCVVLGCRSWKPLSKLEPVSPSSGGLSARWTRRRIKQRQEEIARRVRSEGGSRSEQVAKWRRTSECSMTLAQKLDSTEEIQDGSGIGIIRKYFCIIECATIIIWRTWATGAILVTLFGLAFGRAAITFLESVLATTNIVAIELCHFWAGSDPNRTPHSCSKLVWAGTLQHIASH